MWAPVSAGRGEKFAKPGFIMYTLVALKGGINMCKTCAAHKKKGKKKKK